MSIELIARDNHSWPVSTLFRAPTRLEVQIVDIAAAHHSQASGIDAPQRISAVVDGWQYGECCLGPLECFGSLLNTSGRKFTFFWRELKEVERGDLLLDGLLFEIHALKRRTRAKSSASVVSIHSFLSSADVML